jgi:Spy/CpxP family protein refolding chaperone
MRNIKKIGFALAVTVALCTASVAHEGGKEMRKYGILELPHPLKLALEKAEELKLDAKQQGALSAIIGENPVKIMPLFESANKLEKKIKHSFMHDGKSKAELETDVKELTKIKAQITDYQMNVIDKMKAILSKEQWNQLISIMKGKQGC